MSEATPPTTPGPRQAAAQREHSTPDRMLSGCGPPCEALKAEHHVYHLARLEGRPGAEAYGIAYPQASNASRRTGAPRLDKRPDIRLAMAYHQGLAERPPGRPTKLTPEVHRLIVELVQQGHPEVSAAAAVGVGRSAYYTWLRRGHAGDGQVFVDFAHAIDDAKTRGQFRFESALFDEVLGRGEPRRRQRIVRGEVVEEVVESLRVDTRAVLEILARRAPETWRKTDRLEVKPITPEEAETELRRLLAWEGQRDDPR